MEVRIQRVRPQAQMPARATQGAAGVDLRACVPREGMVLQPMERALIPTGIAIELPKKNMVALVFARSGLALREGLALANGVGVIDSDYRGEICVPLINLSAGPLCIADDERIAQMVVLPTEAVHLVETETLVETQRGGGGFGSTGKD